MSEKTATARAGKRGGGKRARSAPPKGARLGPGELDKLVLAYMRRHKNAAPLSPSAVAKRSSAPRARWPIALTGSRRWRRCDWPPKAPPLRTDRQHQVTDNRKQAAAGGAEDADRGPDHKEA